MQIERGKTALGAPPLFVCAMALTGCYGMADYIHAEDGGPRPLDPETLRVDSKAFPTFAVVKDFQPPPAIINPPTLPIKATDRWNVRYKAGNYYLLHSDTYAERMCQLAKRYGMAYGAMWSDRCVMEVFYTIAVDQNGRIVSPGWQLIPNPERILGSNRRTQLILAPDTPDAWKGAPPFAIVH